jgi:hypothetical protein
VSDYGQVPVAQQAGGLLTQQFVFAVEFVQQEAGELPQQLLAVGFEQQAAWAAFKLVGSQQLMYCEVQHPSVADDVICFPAQHG